MPTPRRRGEARKFPQTPLIEARYAATAMARGLVRCNQRHPAAPGRERSAASQFGKSRLKFVAFSKQWAIRSRPAAKIGSSSLRQ
jgi:hypothetical protein